MLKRILILSFVVLFALISFSAFAGNTSTVTQTGNNNNAAATQDGNLNNASITQVANTSNATQSQTGGNSNDAIIEQKSGWPVPGQAVISETGVQIQVGSNNIAKLWQYANELTGGNIGNQNQAGLRNIVWARQFCIDSDVDQDQIGNDNQAYSFQIGYQQWVKQYQAGNNNWASVDEQTGGETYGFQIAEQTQTGNRNSSVISQSGPLNVYDKNTRSNIARVLQTGSDNYAGTGWYLAPGNGTTQRGSFNNANLAQIGDSNGSTPLLTCTGVVWTPLAGFTTIGIQYQLGEYNDADIDIFGNSNQTAQYQNGNTNHADLDINGSSNQTKQVQLGNSNTSDIVISGSSNQAGTYQDGGHTATITITGTGNNAYVNQSL